MKKMFNEENHIHNFMSSSGSGTVINYGSGSDFLTSYGSGSGSISQKVTVPTVPVPVPQHCLEVAILLTTFLVVYRIIFRCFYVAVRTCHTLIKRSFEIMC
jgi:hypothetical protein